MENLIFAFHAVAPSFSIVLLGMVLKKTGILTDAFILQGNRLCFQILFPILVFFNLYDAAAIDFTYLKAIVFCVGVVLVSVTVMLLVVPRFVPDRRRTGVMIQCMYRANFMLYGLPFSQSLGGTASITLATSIMAATLPLLNTLGVFVYSAFSDASALGGKPDVRQALMNALKNPIIWGVILGLLFYLLRMPIPDFLHTAGGDVAKTATPLAFLFLGGQFQLRSAGHNFRALAAGLTVKLILMPILFLWAAVCLFDIRGTDLIPVFIFLAAPTAITNYQMAIQYHADYELAGDFLVYSMAFSAFTLFLFIYFLRGMGLI